MASATFLASNEIPTFPTNLPSPEAERWWLEHKTQIFTSPLSGREQRLALQRARWRADVVLPFLQEHEARQLAVFVANLQGAKGQFLYSPAHKHSANWCEDIPIVATPPADNAADVADEANKTASTKLYVDLLKNSNQHQINAGDYFAIYSNLGQCALHIVTNPWQAPEEGARFTTIDIAPPLRFEPLVSSEIELQRPQATMRLLNDQQAKLFWRRGLIVDGLTIALSEVL